MRRLLFGAVLALSGCVGGADSVPAETPVAKVQPVRAYVLDDPAYRFCHETGPYSEDLRPWCSIEHEIDPARCPGFHKLCARPPSQDIATPLGGCDGVGGAAPPIVPVGAPEPSSGPEVDWSPRASCEPPETSLGWLGIVVQSLVAFIIALGVLVVLRLVLWAIMSRRRRNGAVEHGIVASVPAIETVAPDEIPDIPSEDLLGAAEAALRDGRTGDSILLARAAALRHLADRGVVRLHRARTDREYLRGVRRRPEVEGPLRVVVRWVEQLRWGGGEPLSDDARAVLTAVRSLIGAVAVLSLVVVGMGADIDYRYGPQGDAAIADAFETGGYTVSWRLRSLANIDDETDVLVIDLSGIEPSEDDWQAIRAWVDDGGMLVVGGAAEAAFGELGERVEAMGQQAEALWSVTRPVWPAMDVSGWQGGSAQVVVEDRLSGAALVASIELGAGRVVALSDPRLLWNASLLSAANEAFLVELLDLQRGVILAMDADQVHVQLALLASASSSDNPLETLWNAQLLPFLAQLMFTLALGALWLGWPFAPLRDPEQAGRQQFSDHVGALARRYERLGARPWVVSAYARWALLRYGPAGLLSRAQRDGRTPSEAADWVQRTQQLADGETSSDNLADLEELWKTTHRD